MPRVACAINFFPMGRSKLYNVSNNDDVLMCLLSTKYGIEMVQLTSEQRVFVVKTYFQTEKYTEVRRLFQERYPDRPPPNKTAIWKNVNATSLNMNQGENITKKTLILFRKPWKIIQGGFPVVRTG